MSSWELPSEDCQKFVCIQQCLLCTVTQKWLWSTWENLWMDDVDCFVGTSRCGWLGGEICMLVRGKRIKGKPKKCGCVSKNHRGDHMEFWNGGPAILQELCSISSFYQARKILRVAVGLVGSSHMRFATDFIAKMAVRDLMYLRKDLIQNCLRKLTWDL